jgi:hypothetical protein
MSTTGGQFCYTYSNSDGDLPLTLNCPVVGSKNATDPSAPSPSNATITTGVDWYQAAIKTLVKVTTVGKVSGTVGKRDVIPMTGKTVRLFKRDEQVCKYEQYRTQFASNSSVLSLPPDNCKIAAKMFNMPEAECKGIQCQAYADVYWANMQGTSDPSLREFCQNNPNAVKCQSSSSTATSTQ